MLWQKNNWEKGLGRTIHQSGTEPGENLNPGASKTQLVADVQHNWHWCALAGSSDKFHKSRLDELSEVVRAGLRLSAMQIRTFKLDSQKYCWFDMCLKHAQPQSCTIHFWWCRICWHPWQAYHGTEAWDLNWFRRSCGWKPPKMLTSSTTLHW